MRHILISLLVSLAVTCALNPPNSRYQYQPVIGIFTQPSNDLNQTIYPSDKYQYISSSYVKWLQTSGAKVVPVPYDLSDSDSDELLGKLNGLLFPGGDASQWNDDNNWNDGFSPMTLSAQRWINKIIDLNNNGTHFPVWGTCMGYEMIVLAMTNNLTLLNFVNSPNHVLNTEIVDFNKSPLFQSLSGQSLQAVQFREALYYNHRHAITLENLSNQPILTNFFELTSYAIDNNGTSFVGSLEGKKVPIYLSQFHPEKNSYEWLEEVHANHSSEAINAAAEMGNFFVAEARRNKNRLTQDEMKIMNIEEDLFTVVYDAFVSVYVFKNRNFTSTEIY